MRKNLHIKNLSSLLALAFIFVVSIKGWGQTNPVAFDLSTGSFTFASQTATSTSYPTNMQGWTTGTGNITAITTAAPGANQALVASGSASTSGLSNLGANGFNFLSTSSAPNTQVGEIAVALNSSGRTNILISWTAADNLATASRVSALALQYRIGTSGTFTTVAGTTYTTTAAAQAAAQNFSNIALPSSCNNQPVVQVRWIYWEVSGAGGRDPIRLDDITISSSAVATPPTLTAASATVDADFNITYTDDATWRGAITAVKYGATTLTSVTDYSLASGILTLKPTGGNVVLRIAGTQTVTVIATGYADATVSQAINAGVPTSNSTASINASLTPNTTRTITCTAKDQYNNLVAGYVFKYDATITNSDGTTAESYTIDGIAQIATANDINMVATTNGSGVAVFTAALPAIVDNNDGVSIQVQLNNGTTNIGSPFTYYELPAQTISFGSLSNVTYGDAPFTVSATGGGSGNPVTFTSSNPAIATCSGTNGETVTIIAPGTCSIYANQAGNGSYNAAAQVAQLLTVNVKTLTILSPVANNKVYNGTNTATITGTLSPVVGADVVTLTLSGTFASVNVATGIAVTSTSVLGGANASKYILSQPTGLTANITTKPLTISGKTATNKVYDATVTNSLSGTAALVGVIAADIANVTLDIATVTSNFADNLVGTAKPVTVTGYSISGTASGNYSLSQPTGLTANITAKPLTIAGLSANNKVQDGTTTATLSGTATLTGVETIDISNVSIAGTPTATFASSGVATGIAVSVSGYSLSGSAAANYSVSQPTGLTANITGLSAPVATAATSILQTQFNANWSTVTDANNGYLLDVATTNTFGGTIISENFAGFVTNNGSTDRSGALNTYLQTTSWTGAAIYEMTGYTKLGTAALRGVITTPTIDLSANSGNATLNFDLSVYGTDATLVQVFHAADGVTFVQVGADITPPASLTTQTVGITGGTVNSKIRIQAKTAANNRFYIDNFKVSYSTTLPGYNAKPIAGQASITSTVNTLAENTTYYYRLRAVNGTTQSANSNVITVTTKSTFCTWNGSVWSNTTGPDADIEAVIAGIYSTTASGAFTAKKITVNSGSLTINSGTNLTVQNELINNMAAADVVIENNANLIQVNDIVNTGAITVKRNSASQVRLDHTLWSSPVANQNLFGFSPQTLTNRFYVYNTPTNTYVTTGLSAASVFTPAKGFAVRAPNNYTTTPQIWEGIFSGVPNNGTTPYTLETTGTGYNLVGNPYPSAINATTFVSAINNPAIDGTLYFYAHTLTMNASGQFPAGTNYAMWNSGSGGVAATLGTSGVPANIPNGIIQAGQGFLVKAASSGTVNFTNAMRVGNNANQFFRANATTTTAATLERHRLWFNLTDATGSTFNQIMIAYAEGATQGVDRDYDGLAYGNTGSALSSKIGGQDFTIQGRSLPFNDEDVVSLGFKAATAGNYTISLSMMDGLFLDSQEVFIRDVTTGLVHNIKTAPFTFYSDAGIFDARFEIIYSTLLAVPNHTFDKASVVVYKNQGVFHVNTKSIIMKEIVVFDINGRMIFKQSGINSNTAVLSGLNTNTAALLFKIVSENEETVTVKVLN